METPVTPNPKIWGVAIPPNSPRIDANAFHPMRSSPWPTVNSALKNLDGSLGSLLAKEIPLQIHHCLNENSSFIPKPDVADFTVAEPQSVLHRTAEQTCCFLATAMSPSVDHTSLWNSEEYFHHNCINNRSLITILLILFVIIATIIIICNNCYYYL